MTGNGRIWAVSSVSKSGHDYRTCPNILSKMQSVVPITVPMVSSNNSSNGYNSSNGLPKESDHQLGMYISNQELSTPTSREYEKSILDYE